MPAWMLADVLYFCSLLGLNNFGEKLVKTNYLRKPIIIVDLSICVECMLSLM